MLIEQENVRTYIEFRHRYLISTVYSICTLFVSTASSLIIVVILHEMCMENREPLLLVYLGSTIQVIILTASLLDF